MEVFQLDFMRQAMLAAFLVGVAAPLVGVFLVQRKMSLIGDGMGHVALAGVAIGVLTGQAPILTALALTVAGAVAVELIRVRGRSSGDIALAVMFYGGIALGVVVISRSSGSSAASLTGFLFGAILTTTAQDLVVFAVLAVVVLGVTLVLRSRLFAVAQDEEYSRASGLPVTGYNLTLAILTAVTVVVSMRVVGLLLISALMILPNATAQLIGRSFASTVRWAVVIGVVSSIGGVWISYYLATPSGGTIVLVAIALFLLTTVLGATVTRIARRRVRVHHHPHEHGPGCGHEAVAHAGHIDYVHDGHLHSPHEDHYDEHGTSR